MSIVPLDTFVVATVCLCVVCHIFRAMGRLLGCPLFCFSHILRGCRPTNVLSSDGPMLIGLRRANCI